MRHLVFLLALGLGCGKPPSAPRDVPVPVLADASPAVVDVLPAGARIPLGATGCHVAAIPAHVRFLDDERLLVIDGDTAHLIEARSCAELWTYELHAPHISSNGRWVVGFDEEDHGVVVAEVGGTTTRTIRKGVTDAHLYPLALSDDGSTFVLHPSADDEGNLACVPVWRGGAAPRTICPKDIFNIFHVELSADGERVVAVGLNDVVVSRTRDGRELARWPAVGGTWIDGEALAAPSGHAWVAAVAAHDRGLEVDKTTWQIAMTDADGAVLTRFPISSTSGLPGWVDVSPSGTLVAVGDHGLVRVFDAATGALVGPPRNGLIDDAAFSRDGATVVTASVAGVQRWSSVTGELIEELAPPDLGKTAIGVWQRLDGVWAWASVESGDQLTVHVGARVISLGRVGSLGTFPVVAVAPVETHLAVATRPRVVGAAILIDLEAGTGRELVEADLAEVATWRVTHMPRGWEQPDGEVVDSDAEGSLHFAYRDDHRYLWIVRGGAAAAPPYDVAAVGLSRSEVRAYSLGGVVLSCARGFSACELVDVPVVDATGRTW